MDRTELAWAAGFWDGEGSAYLTGSRERGTRQPQARINQAGQGGMPEVLVRFHAAVGRRGTLHGPEKKIGRKDLYYWAASSRATIVEVAELLAPWLGPIKLAQFATTLGTPVLTLRRNGDAPIGRDEDCAWAAGFFDGEGSVYLRPHRSHAGFFIVEAALTQSSATGRSEELERFGAIAAQGRIYGPINDKRGVTPYWRWKDTKTRTIRSVVESLWPWLGSVKKAQAEAALRIVEAQPMLPRGNPA